MLRNAIVAEVSGHPQDYTTAFLEMPNHEYCAWIRRPGTWGGAIELAILSKYYSHEIGAWNVEAQSCQVYGEEQGYKKQARGELAMIRARVSLPPLSFSTPLPLPLLLLLSHQRFVLPAAATPHSLAPSPAPPRPRIPPCLSLTFCFLRTPSSMHPARQVMIIYSNNNHYDALAVAAHPKAPEAEDTTVFNPRTKRGRMIIDAARTLIAMNKKGGLAALQLKQAAEAAKAKAAAAAAAAGAGAAADAADAAAAAVSYRCTDCSQVLKGEVEMARHAQGTGHKSFAQQQVQLPVTATVAAPA